MIFNKKDPTIILYLIHIPKPKIEEMGAGKLTCENRQVSGYIGTPAFWRETPATWKETPALLLIQNMITKKRINMTTS